MIRFGMLTWLPIYLLQVKGFSKAEMSVAFLFFEWAAIPSTIFAGYISDKFFKGYRMPPAIIAISIIFFCIFGYWQSESLLWVTFFAAIVGCLIYIPQFLASVQLWILYHHCSRFCCWSSWIHELHCWCKLRYNTIWCFSR